MISAKENDIILLDTKTGKYWRRFVPTGKGPTDWTAENMPNLKKYKKMNLYVDKRTYVL